MSFLQGLLESSVFVTPTLGYCAWAIVNPRSRFFGRVYHSADPLQGRKYALTFDDGPTEPHTGRILDVLAEMRAKATFFVVGQNVEKNPRLLQRMHAEGHLIGNHSWDHPHFGMLRGPLFWLQQLGRTDRIIADTIGVRPQLFRPPLGAKTWFNCMPARRMGYSVITWSRRSFDGVATTSQEILDRLVPHTIAGDILVLHDGVGPNSSRDPHATIEAIRPLIQQLRDRGLEPAPLDQMLSLPAYAVLGQPAPVGA